MRIEQTINPIVVNIVSDVEFTPVPKKKPTEQLYLRQQGPIEEPTVEESTEEAWDMCFRAYINKDSLPADYETKLKKDSHSYYLIQVPGRDNAFDILHSFGSTIKTIRVVEEGKSRFTYGIKGTGDNDYDRGYCARASSITRVLAGCQLPFPHSFNQADTYAADPRLNYGRGW